MRGSELFSKVELPGYRNWGSGTLLLTLLLCALFVRASYNQVCHVKKIARILRCSSWIICYENKIHVISNGVLKEVPKIGEREKLFK